MTNELLAKMYEDYWYTYGALMCSGAQFDTQCTSDKAIYFTYPDSYAAECADIENLAEDVKEDFRKMESLLGQIGLSGNPADVCPPIVKKFILKSGMMADPTSIDTWEEYQELLEFAESDFFSASPTIYAKPREGVVWTKQDMLNGLESVNDAINRFIHNIVSRKGYKQV